MRAKLIGVCEKQGVFQEKAYHSIKLHCIAPGEDKYFTGYYDVCTLCFDKTYHHEILDCYLNDRKSAENAYNLLLKFSKIRYKGGE